MATKGSSYHILAKRLNIGDGKPLSGTELETVVIQFIASDNHNSRYRI